MDNNWNENNNYNSVENQNQSVQNPQQQVFPSENRNSSMNNNNILKNKKVIIIGGVVIALLLFFILTSCGGRKVSTNNGYTEKYGNALKVKEVTSNFELKVIGDLETFTDEDSYNNSNYLTLKVSVKNISNQTLDFALTSFSLVDENKETLVSDDSYNSFDDSISNMEIGSGKQEEGTIYFSEKEASNAKSNAKYLKVSVISSAKEISKGNYSYEKEDYYLEIK